MLDTIITWHRHMVMLSLHTPCPTHPPTHRERPVAAFWITHPLQHKLAVIRSLKYIVNEADRSTELNHIKTALHQCGYEPRIMWQWTEGRMKAWDATRRNARVDVVIYFVHGVVRLFQSTGIRTHYKLSNTISGNMVAHKDQKEVELSSGALYIV